MIVPEKEARNKLCPLAGLVALIEKNIHPDSRGNYCCNASDCMWWEWHSLETNEGDCGIAGREK